MKRKAYIILVIIIGLSVMLLVNGVNNRGNKAISSITEYNSIEKLVKGTSFSFNIPKILLNEQGLNYENIANQMVKISNENVEFKAAPFIGDKADVGGIYTSYNNDSLYETINKNIENIRIRYNDNSEGILINWKYGNTAYFLKTKNGNGLEDALAILELTESDVIKLINDDKIIEETNDILKYTYELKDINARIKLPTDNLIVVYDEYNKVTNIFLNNTIVLSIYTLDRVDTYMEEIKLTDGYKMGYININNNKLTEINKDGVELIINNIEDIKNSFNKIE